jgi:threonine-phosphate decarboxylase
VGRSRGVLKRGLEQLGLRVIDGRANYLLFQCPYRPEGGKGREDESPLYDALLARGFLIRRCADYHGLDPTWYRVAVKTMGENEKLLAVLRQALGEVRS